MKIQFIVVGWYYNQDSLQNGLKELNKNYDNINVFYSCHKKPTQFIRDNFEWKLFPNLGEEQVAYQQALEYLNLENDTYCFFMNDDLIIKNWIFVEKCVNKLQQGYKVVGNGYNPGFKAYNPLVTIPIGIAEEFDGKQSIDYVQEKNRHFFKGPIEMNMVRGSFWSMQYSTVKAIGGFEPRKEAWLPFNINENGKAYYRGCKDVSNTKTGGLARFGNLFANLTIYKINKLFGKDSVTWLDPKNYRNSEYIYELERGID